MVRAQQAVTPDTLGAWLLKARPDAPGFRDLAATGFRTVDRRCVRPSYRTDLVRPGQRVLLWVSGADQDLPAGIHGRGRITGLPAATADAVLDLPMTLERVEPPVLRDELRAHPLLSRIEVLRMPAGSNPSYVTLSELEELHAHWPQVVVG